ncbi:uncharacterized protein LOC101214550 [Cucumis sativus]|uniref:GIR1-like zinc ribbon domain-containing protein n=1 Tax=Cucumis sativus TaxID=3659 RepID=A0A0A0K3J9_CUCSA|nr:uncharacterized protein LOC101214550 [Cucumis sativus]KGN44280.1 hypothetical protein Csa_016628 [Cucumis sativus]
MAAEVSSLIRVLAGYKDDDNRTALGNGQDSTALVTRDLLGQSSNLTDSQELDLDLQVPTGWEKRLDLKSGKVYIQRSQTPDSPLNSDSKQIQMINQTESKFQDLNFPPSPSKRTLNLFNETSLDLKLTSSPSSTNYASVCTLDKVKSALERADKELVKKRSSLWKSASSPSYSSSSSSAAAGKEIQEEEAAEIRNSAAPMAVGCPGCLSYVLVMKNNPRCPRCNSVVPLPTIKKPRIDLNMSI